MLPRDQGPLASEINVPLTDVEFDWLSNKADQLDVGMVHVIRACVWGEDSPIAREEGRDVVDICTDLLEDYLNILRTGFVAATAGTHEVRYAYHSLQPTPVDLLFRNVVHVALACSTLAGLLLLLDQHGVAV